MTLPAAFPLSASQINVELGRSAGAAFDMQGTLERALAQVPAGAISMSDFLGKSDQTVVVANTGDIGSISSPFTFSGVNFGPASSARLLTVITGLRGGGIMNISSVTIGGNATTGNDSGYDTGSGFALGVGLFSAIVTTGTSGNVVVTWGPANATAAGIILLSTPRIVSSTRDDFKSPGGVAGTTNWSQSVNVTSFGTVISAVAHGGTASNTWTGLTRRDGITLGGNTKIDVAFDNKLPTETGHGVSVSWSGSAVSSFELASYHQ